jgi:hypothetical protein
MNHELAQKLKDARFPFKDCYNECCEGHPTLSELIVACNGFFGNLTHYPKHHAYPCDYCGEDGESEHWGSSALTYLEPIVGCGETPEEAVAKLWLEINNKIK